MLIIGCDWRKVCRAKGLLSKDINACTSPLARSPSARRLLADAAIASREPHAHADAPSPPQTRQARSNRHSTSSKCALQCPCPTPTHSLRGRTSGSPEGSSFTKVWKVLETRTNALPGDPHPPEGNGTAGPGRAQGRPTAPRGARARRPLPRGPESSVPPPHPAPGSSLLQIAAEEAQGTRAGNG